MFYVHAVLASDNQGGPANGCSGVNASRVVQTIKSGKQIGKQRHEGSRRRGYFQHENVEGADHASAINGPLEKVTKLLRYFALQGPTKVCPFSSNRRIKL